MLRKTLSRIGEHALQRNSINPNTTHGLDLLKNGSIKLSSEAVQQNKGEGTTSTKPTEQNSAPSDLENLRRRHGLKRESKPQDSILSAKPGDPAYPGSPGHPVYRPENASSPDTPREERPTSVKDTDSIVNAKPGDPAYPGSPAAFDPRLRS